MAPPPSYNEEKNILICGPKSSGKTSLAFTLCRGIYPEAAGLPEGLPGNNLTLEYGKHLSQDD